MRMILLLASAAALGAGGLRAASAATGESTIYSFTDGNDGGFPQSGLTYDRAHGMLYGTATSGGAGHAGTVYGLRVPKGGVGGWSETTLYSFTGGADGGVPAADVMQDQTGALYGTTLQGGSSYGVVYKLTPPAAGQTGWTETVLHSFTGGADGGVPDGKLIEDAAGNLYGTASQGGSGVVGVVFELSPPAAGQTAWTEQVLYNFTGNADGGEPLGRLVFGPGNALYGTTAGYGANNVGTVYALTQPSAPGGTWGFHVIHSFAGGVLGEVPRDGLIAAPGGKLYGTTAGFASSQGSVFELVQPKSVVGNFGYRVLYDFSGLGFDGNGPWQTVSMDQAGNLYGTTLGVGLSADGEVFKLTPPATQGGQWKESVLTYFTGGANGQFLYSDVLLIGTTLFGTTYGEADQSGFYPGTVWIYQQ